MILLLSRLFRGRPVATDREMLSLSHLDDRLLRDIGLRRTDLYAGPAERLRPACCTGAARRWAGLVDRLRGALSTEPVSCCQS